MQQMFCCVHNKTFVQQMFCSAKVLSNLFYEWFSSSANLFNRHFLKKIGILFGRKKKTYIKNISQERPICILLWYVKIPIYQTTYIYYQKSFRTNASGTFPIQICTSLTQERMSNHFKTFETTWRCLLWNQWYNVDWSNVVYVVERYFPNHVI
jgi:hypothetical protein